MARVNTAQTALQDESIKHLLPLVAETTSSLAASPESSDDFDELARQWDTNEWHATPCWTAESPFGVWGAMEIGSGNDFGVERPSD